MLDQNTDRMWYVIGAVIVGSALIFLMNSTFPGLFGTVGETFEDKVDTTTEMTDGIRPPSREVNLIGVDDLEPYESTIDAYDAKTDTWTLTVKEERQQWNYGLSVKRDRVAVPYGATFTIRYDVFVPAGKTGLTAKVDINNAPLSGTATPWGSYNNDNDAIEERRFNGSSEIAVPLAAGEWTTVTATYRNAHEKNTAQLPVYDYSRIGLHSEGGPIQIQVRNITGVVTK